MEYKCSVCSEKVQGGLIDLREHTDKHIVDLIKEKHPEWVEENGICQKCIDYYQQQISGESS